MRKVLFLLLLVLFSTSLSYSSDLHRSAEPIVIKNGLNNNTIYDVFHAGDGFIWLSTDNGITRYDGFRFRNYPLVYSIDSLSIPLPKAVKRLQETSDNLFYALLYQGGVIGFDKNKEMFLPLRFDHPFKLRDILDFYLEDGNLYLATSHGLYESRALRGEGGDFIMCKLNPEPLVKGKVNDLCTDGKTNLYFTLDGKKVVHYDLVTKKTSLIKEYGVVGHLFLQRGHLWICKLWNDVVCYDLKKKTERVLTMGVAGKSDYSNSYITDLVCRDKRTYYLTSWAGLFKLEFENDDLIESTFKLTMVTHSDRTPQAYIENKMTSALWDDKQRILWVGTFGGGIVKYDISDSMYSRVQQSFDSGINGVAEDARGYIWLAMADGGIMKSTTPALSMGTRFEPWKEVSTLSGRCQIYKDKNGNIWLGSNQGEVVFVNPIAGSVESIRLQINEKEGTPTVIHQFCVDSWNRLWVATSNGLILVDTKTREFKKIALTNGAEVVFSVAEDKEGNIWIGTDKGLKRLEVVGSQIQLKGNYEAENGLEETGVRSIYVNNYNQIYASYLNVVIRIDGRDKDKIESVYTLQNGLTSGHIACMVDDHIGNTWAGNNVGVMTIRNGQDAFYNYLTVGNCSSVCRLHDGRLLWANSWGLLYFDPSVTKKDGGKRQLMLTDVEVGGAAVLAGEKQNGQMVLTVAPEKQKELVFGSDNSEFHLYFSDLRYGMMQRKIAYRLLPDGKEWRMKPLAEGLGFNGLPAGKYTLQAKLVFPDGREGDTIEVPIVVKAKWYHTIWAYLIYGLLIVALLYVFFQYFRKRDIRKQIHRDREMILRENLAVEKLKQEQKQEIEGVRNRMLMLFVQELRTPLSLIIAPLKEFQKENLSMPNASLQVAYRNSLRMLDACNQLFSIYGQGSDGNARVEVALYGVEKVVESTLLGIRELLKVYDIDFKYEKRIKPETEFYVDKKKLTFIIHNLLTNAFTHTHYAGVVSFTITETVQEDVHYVSFVIEDNGDKEVKTAEQLLDENGELNNDLSAVQLGFIIMQQMVQLHHGTISLKSTAGEGTKVIVNLPLDKAVLERDMNVSFVDPEELTEENVQQPLSGEQQLTSEMEQTDLVVEDIVKQEYVIPGETLVADDTAPIPAGAKKTVLVVEDHKDIRLYLKVLFGKEYNLLMATNGQEGVDIAMKEIPDLIICDVMMPVKDGFECCREVKENPETCSIPFIMLTAKVEDEDIIHGLELGADDYVLKPFTPGILKAKVRNLIYGRQTLKQMYTKLFMLPGTDASATGESEKTEEEVKTEDPFINSIIKIIEENICEADFSVKKLASEMNMSQPTLYRKVKQSTDYTIIELIRGVRMRRAGVLLKTKQYAVQEVAEMVGYNDVPTFRKHFVDAFGTTPSTYE